MMTWTQLSLHGFKERFFSNRMKILWPLLSMFILGAAWGLSDPNIRLPAQIPLDSAYSILYVSSAFIL